MEEVNQETSVPIKTSNNEDIEENDKVEEVEENRQIEEIAAEIIQPGSEEQYALTVEGESHEKEQEDEGNTQTEVASPDQQIPKNVVVITTSETEEGNTHEISVPINPPIRTHNIFQSIVDDIGQFEEDLDQGQESENTILEDIVPGENQQKMMQMENTKTNHIRESPEKSVTD
ncbi:hypothetical protein RND71_001673 [Anisodus tanguticus]|uniref:Uncharacterized protein n=1 Tax=Anisodus tanguticus TaxID=243964 RepID=A0AAE1VW10_9SOLA|nr:hypothetical protein RND71_001673 [Anisodus tanguticus]